MRLDLVFFCWSHFSITIENKCIVVPRASMLWVESVWADYRWFIIVTLHEAWALGGQKTSVSIPFQLTLFWNLFHEIQDNYVNDFVTCILIAKWNWTVIFLEIFIKKIRLYVYTSKNDTQIIPFGRGIASACFCSFLNSRFFSYLYKASSWIIFAGGNFPH